MSQIVLEPTESRPTVQSPPEHSSSQPLASQPSRELLTAWLLLLLNRKATHGYALRRQLEAHGVEAEPGTLYRTLRRLESEGRAASTWAQSAAGPRRRLYRLTPHGRSHLDELVAAITVTRDVHAAFLLAHQAGLE